MPQCDHFDDPTTCKFCAPRDVVVARFEERCRQLSADLEAARRDADTRQIIANDRWAEIERLEAKIQHLESKQAPAFTLSVSVMVWHDCARLHIHRRNADGSGMAWRVREVQHKGPKARARLAEMREQAKGLAKLLGAELDDDGREWTF